MSWVKDTVSLGAIAQELQRRTGTKYPWGEYKSHPRGDACQCSDCQRERDKLLAQAEKRDLDLNCPQRAAHQNKPKEQYHPMTLAGMLYGTSMFGCTRGSEDIWSEVVKEADAPKPQAEPEQNHEQKAMRKVSEMKIEFHVGTAAGEWTEISVKADELKKKISARTPLNTIKAPPGQRQPNKKKKKLSRRQKEGG